MNTLDNPNLDGDFKALIKAQEARRAERAGRSRKPGTAAGGTPLDIDAILEDDNANIQPGLETDALQKQKKDDPEINAIRREMFSAVTNDDVHKIHDIIARLSEKGLKVTDERLRDSDTRATVLHKACTDKAINVTRFLIESQDHKFLMEEYEITVRNIPSKKTVLHQLVEWGQPVVAQFLSKIPEGESKQQYMRKTVLTEVPGQRPRHLQAIHIASLHGHTDLIRLLINQGIDVNTTNNKNDTPILWAVRGNHIETARKLMQLGADVHLQNDKGSSPLYFSVRYGFEEMLIVLIKEGKANVHQQRKLGLISPIVLSSALGNIKIVKSLIDHGADVNLKITGGFTPLHHAATQGNSDIVELLLDRGADIHVENDAGDNALLLAAQENQIEVVELLVERGANFAVRNKQGLSIWDFAVEAEENDLLIAVVNSYRKSTQQKLGAVTRMPHGKTPLHSAAIKGDCEKVRVLKSLGMDLGAEDEGQNTFFHLAARENQFEVLEEFIDSVNVNAQNSEQESALHLAARNGHYEAIRILLKKISVGVTNSSGETALHVACRSRRAHAEVIGQMVDTIVKAHNWSLVDATDRHGDTALHVAARWGRSDIMEQLRALNPRLLNTAGDSPFHVAIKEGHFDVVEIMLEIFGKDININQQNRDGNSVLHIASTLGDGDIVELLIQQGADLSLGNNDGNTMLHLLAMQCVDDPDNTSRYLNVFSTVVSNTVRWWCMRKDLMQPDSQCDAYEKYRRTALVHLTSGLPNNERLTVNMLAARRGAKDLLERILHVPNVYVFQKDSNFLFDVTDLTHETMASAIWSKKKKSSGSSASSTSKVSPSQVSVRSGTSELDQEKTSLSCLDLIVRSPNLLVANQMLDIIPIQHIVGNYWSAYQWMYGTIMVIHLVYMSLLSAYAIPLITDDSTDVWPNVLFLSWPAIILLNELYFAIATLLNRFRKKDIQAKQTSASGGNALFRHLDRSVGLIVDYTGHLHATAFSSLVIAWFVLYLTSSAKSQAYVLSIAMILGWMYTIAFTEGFESVHAFTIMLKNIVIRDMTRFMFLYVLVMLGFSMAFQCFFCLAEELQKMYPDAWSIYFVTFNMMIGLGEIFYDGFDENPNSQFIKIIYLFYIVLTTVILLNLLIAMMTDSYAAVKAREGTTWRVGSVRLAVELEKNMPFLPQMFKFLGIKSSPFQIDPDTRRWIMTIPKKRVMFHKEVTRNNVVEVVDRLEKEIRDLKLQYTDIGDKLQVLMERSERPGSATGRPTSAGRFKRSVAALQAKMSLEKRASVIRHRDSDLSKFQKASARAAGDKL